MRMQWTRGMVALTIVGCLAWISAPLPAATLELQLVADNLAGSDGDPITSWADTSGNGREAVVSAGWMGGVSGGTLRTNPVLVNGHSVVEMAAGGEGFAYEDGSSTPIGYEDMVTLNTGMTWVGVQRVILSANDAGLYQPNTGWSVYLNHAWPSAGNSITVAQSGGTARTFDIAPMYEFYVVVATLSNLTNGASNTGEVWIHDSNSLEATKRVSNTWTNSAAPSGQAGFFNNPGGSAELAELRIYDGVLSEIEIQGLTNTLAATYGIPYVPEPVSALLIGLGGAMMIRRRR